MGGWVDNQLHRVIYASRATDQAGLSTLSLARILGAAERNNRRDGVTGCLMMHGAHIVQVLEGERAVLDRLLDRLRADARHGGLRILVDAPIPSRRYDEPMGLCGETSAAIGELGLVDLVPLAGASVEPWGSHAVNAAGAQRPTAFAPA